MAFGVCRGANVPIQNSYSELRYPDSTVVGTPGSAEARRTLLTASADNLPSLINDKAGRIGQK